ncbi:MAG: family 20 glycosylhydrolase [Promethearchaeota archaeon]
MTEPLMLIPFPKQINKLEENNAYILSSECILTHFNISKPKLLINDINKFLRSNTSIKLKEGEIKDSDRYYLEQKSEWDILDINNEEAYNIEIKNNKICIYGKFEKGLFYGVQTIIQLMKNALLSNKKLIKAPINERSELYLPEIEIKDVPDLKIRGVSLDISRGQIFTVKSAKRFLKILSHYKLNFCCFYIEDVFSHPKHPKIGKKRGRLTINQIKQIDKFAREHYVELVPIFECLGHADNILMHEEYMHLGEFPGAHCFDLSNPEIYSFIEDYISELSKSFSTEYFHIGCDEPYDLGKGRSKEYCKKQGVNNIMIEFCEKIIDITKRNNNQNVIIYHDLLNINDDIILKLNKNIILMYWNYDPKGKYTEIKKLLNAGFRIILSPSMLNWQRHFPDNKNASENIINLANEAYNYRDYGCLGLITSTWGDQRYYTFRENEIFGSILTGAITWTTPNFNYNEFKNQYGYLFYGINKKYLLKFNEMFTVLSSSVSLYYRVSVLLPPLFYTYLFKHPFPNKKFKSSLKNVKELALSANKCLEIYEVIKLKVNFEKQNFLYIQFGAELAKYLAEKTELSYDVSVSLLKSDINKGELKEIIISLEKFIVKTNNLKERYEKLWLNAAKRPCLDQILNLFDFLIKCYEEKIEQLKLNITFQDPFIESEWIWMNEQDNSDNPCYFRKIIEIIEPISDAVIQCIAGNYMKIYLNNEYLGEVYSRFSLSPLPIYLRVKSFDITKKLKEGENILAIEAHNYEGGKGAFNIYGQNRLKYNRIQQITSDHWWLCTNHIQETEEWRKLDYDDSNWDHVKSYGRPPNLNGDIYKPNLLNGEKSNTQDYFGVENWIKNFIEKKIFQSSFKLIKPFG